MNKKVDELYIDLYEEPKSKHDEVNHPIHYTSSENEIECIDAIQAALTPEEFR